MDGRRRPRLGATGTEPGVQTDSSVARRSRTIGTFSTRSTPRPRRVRDRVEGGRGFSSANEGALLSGFNSLDPAWRGNGVQRATTRIPAQVSRREAGVPPRQPGASRPRRRGAGTGS